MKDQWPHQFIKTTETKEGALGMAKKFICIHCNYFYWDVYPQPKTNCPARVDKMEMKRLLNG